MLHDIVSMVVWVSSGAVLLFLLMLADSLFTKYNDMQEIRNGNVAVTTRFIMKLLSQAYILSQSISAANNLLQALVVSFISFIILLLLESLMRVVLRTWFKLHIEQGTQDGKIAHALFAGSIHVAGALIIGAYL
ncbi:DUF350 domain-containing protein [Paenibacillus sp. GCM10027626]|uniref:DUF350 domain-containing protein n=1 Tax=Paenibacillus sp. GCM10027626 TaxID=3273411 RepID=UPI0036329485